MVYFREYPATCNTNGDAVRPLHSVPTFLQAHKLEVMCRIYLMPMSLKISRHCAMVLLSSCSFDDCCCRPGLDAEFPLYFYLLIEQLHACVITCLDSNCERDNRPFILGYVYRITYLFVSNIVGTTRLPGECLHRRYYYVLPLPVRVCVWLCYFILHTESILALNDLLSI